jgi:ABC-type antimicrobial peptide transport system permease subunit
VGVVEDTREMGLEEEPTGQIYIPLEQAGQRRSQILLLRTAGDPQSLVPSVRSALSGLAPNLPFLAVDPMTELIAPELRSWQKGATFFSLFGALGLILAALGLFATVTYAVARRSRELGIRKALGASSADLLALLLRGSLGPTVAGILAGIAIAFVAGRFLEPLLFHIRATDPAVLAGTATALLAAAFLASLLPGWRVRRIDPTTAMRDE